jgi:hypothetical protein
VLLVAAQSFGTSGGRSRSGSEVEGVISPVSSVYRAMRAVRDSWRVVPLDVEKLEAEGGEMAASGWRRVLGYRSDE